MRDGLAVVWPIFSALLVLMVVLGIAIGFIEGWPMLDGLYFAFVSGLTIGYGDLVPKTTLSRALAICIGFTGILLTGLVAAIGVQDIEYSALQMLVEGERRFAERGITLWLAGLNPGVLEIVRHSGLAERLGRERMFFNAHAAIERFLAVQAAA